MQRKFIIVGLALLLNACARPTDHGQQYIDGVFEEVLNPVPQIVSNKQKDFSTFSSQLEKVISTSPNLAANNQNLYERVQTWLQKGGDVKSLDSFGLSLEQMGGADGYGNVLFTGYFSPVVTMRKTPDETYRYPVYGLPKCSGRCPSREQIYNGALDGQGQEIGYTSSLLDSFIMEVQGSGFVHFIDDENSSNANDLVYFAYAGKNGHAYRSIGRVLIDRGEVAREDMSLEAIKNWVAAHDDETVEELLIQNPSYVFFQPQDTSYVRGSAGVPLLASAAVAADRDYFPMGSVLLAEVPQLDAKGKWTGKHVLKLLMALDTGGAVKKNHLDLYKGVGDEAGTHAGNHKHFGRVWKLSPQEVLTASAL